MNKILPGLAVAAVFLTACGRKEEPAPTPAPASAPRVLVSGVDTQYIDSAVRPQDDFYRHVNGKWLATTAIPADRSNYGAFHKLADDAELQVRGIIEESVAQAQKSARSDAQKVGDFYAAFMDEKRADELGLKPLEGELARIDALKDKKALARQLAHFSRIKVSGPIFFYIDQDALDATHYIAKIGQATPYSGRSSGLGLPDRDYYLSDESKFKDIRAKYVAHIEKILGLAGVKDTGKAAAGILTLETRIAKIHWTRVADRDRDKTNNKYAFADLAKLAPGFDWDGYVAELGIGRSPGITVRQPDYFASLDQLMVEVPLAQWQTYFKWHLLRSYAALLSKPLVDENFAFYGTVLRGIPENRPRWKRGVEATEAALGEALGRIYVERYFPPAARARMETLVQNLMRAYADSIKSLDWMGEETKKKALEKLAKFTPKIGYPSRWKDYSALTVAADDLAGNALRSAEVEYERDRAKLGAAIDRDEWGMTPQTVNAYYNAGLNEIVFPAAILQPPFFNLAADDAVNYGGIGAVIGHEIGHGFDDQGSKSDGDGNLKSWWTAEDRQKFDDRAKLLIAQYDAYCPLPKQCVQGALTVGENIGDLGGLSIAYKAYQLSRNGQQAPVIDGLTGDQRFFMGWAQVWRRLYRDEEMLNRLKTDPHSPSEYRARVVVNLPEFYAAFGVKEGDRMHLPPERQVKIWSR